VATNKTEYLFSVNPESVDPLARVRKVMRYRNTLWSLSWDEPRLDSLVAEFDERLDQIGRGLRRQMVRDLFSGKAKPEEAAEILKVLKTCLDRGLWPEAQADLDEVEAEVLGDPGDLIGFGSLGHAAAD
jgi:hypothetical protein